ncbi:MAG: 2-dehydropantoate 2-reductase [Alteromonadaceae bacterium]|jgi:2-dehydropantoate 2-reductase
MVKNIKPLPWVIIGQGAIGLLWYSHFYKNSKTYGAYLLKYGNAHPQQNINFTHINGISEDIPRQEIPLKSLVSANNILICVKCYQINQVINNISPYLKKGVKLILCHNGMGGLTDLSKKLLRGYTVLTLLTTHGSLKSSSTKIKHTGLGQSELGLAHGEVGNVDKNNVITQLNSVMPTLAWCDNIKEKQWLKLAINCVINPITAIYDIENGQILADKFVRLIYDILSELISVARCEGIDLELNSLTKVVLQVADKTAKNSSSMRCDRQANRKTEIAYINGYIQKLGLHYKVATPVNDKLVAQIQAL